jgi:hypothetical protein
MQKKIHSKMGKVFKTETPCVQEDLSLQHGCTAIQQDDRATLNQSDEWKNRLLEKH